MVAGQGIVRNYGRNNNSPATGTSSRQYVQNRLSAVHQMIVLGQASRVTTSPRTSVRPCSTRSQSCGTASSELVAQGFVPSALALRPGQRYPNTTNNFCKSGITSESIESGIHPDKGHSKGSLLDALFEPVERLLLFPQRGIHRGNVVSAHKLFLRCRQESLQQAARFFLLSRFHINHCSLGDFERVSIVADRDCCSLRRLLESAEARPRKRFIGERLCEVGWQFANLAAFLKDLFIPAAHGKRMRDRLKSRVDGKRVKSKG